MEARGLFLITLFMVLAFSFTGAPSLAQEKEARVYRSGPSQEEVERNFEYEREKERMAWEMLQNSFFDINVGSWLKEPSPTPPNKPLNSKFH